ncbi:MAG: SDR family NAD(P)-dependent oxidoreductase, partial [Deltaproteobacteria bacterium]|nr:SDR family NAD(P)-dependent oxidoreductase [Deltaproteobacteria bacterium]
MRLKDKVIIVTGGGVGIGRAYSLGLAKEGAKVVVADILEKEAKSVASEIKGEGGEASAIPVDVTSAEKTRAMAEMSLQKYGRIDVLVNNAGLYTAIKKKPFMEIPGDEWDKVMAVNLKGLFLCAQAVFPAMKKQGQGKIINISSGTIFSGSPYFLHYVTSKAGVIGFTRALAREVGSCNISVNAVTPGLTISGPQQRDVLTPEQLEDRRRKRCFQRDQLPSDLVGTVIFLSSDDS